MTVRKGQRQAVHHGGGRPATDWIDATETIRQITRYGPVLGLLTVPGETTTAFDIGDIRMESNEGGNFFVVGIENTGDVLVKPAGTVEVSGANGDLLASIPVTMESVYARDQSELRLESRR